MPDKRIEFFARRLRAVNEISALLDRDDPAGHDFNRICGVFVRMIGYTACWIALVDDEGSVRETFEYRANGDSTGIDPVEAHEFVKSAMLNSRDYLINMDPLLKRSSDKNTPSSTKLNSITIKLQHHNMIFGVITVLLEGDYKTVKEERLILSELIKTISFFLYDIDYRKRIRDLFLTIFENTGNATTLIDESTMITYVNSQFEKLSGFSKQDIEGKMSFTRFVHPDDIDMMLRYHRIRRIDPVTAPRNYEFTFINRDRSEKKIYMTIDMVPHTKFSIGSYMDVTEQKRLESEILKISEIERLRIGSDLHDGLGPHLVGVRFMLKALKNSVSSGKLPPVSQINEIEETLGSAVDHVRTMIKGLKPVDIEPDGLSFALEELALRVSSIFGVSCIFTRDADLLMDNNITATHLFYIAREAVNNSVKHGHVKNIAVELKRDASLVVLRVSDDGAGFPKMLDTGRGMGINIMKYRASIINADIEMSNNPSGGALVLCRLRKRNA
jgi:PAS domain S-box-containing protein